MSDSDNIMERFRNAIAAIEARIEAAEASPDIEALKTLKAQREADLKKINTLRSEVQSIIRDIKNG